eukprot:scaffold25124_cov84-Skeletonema_dohrnii-CCMP3373.AAC.1
MAAVSGASSGHLRRNSGADTSKQSLSRDKDASILSWPTIMGHKKLLIAIFTAWRYGARVVHAFVTKMASSGHLRRKSDADTSKQSLSRDKDDSILSWPTIMGHKKLLIAIFTA